MRLGAPPGPIRPAAAGEPAATGPGTVPVGMRGGLDMIEKFGLEAVKALFVVPGGHHRPDADPEDQPYGREQEAPGQAGVAGAIEIDDGPDRAHDLAERLEGGHEAVEAGEGLKRHRAPEEARAR